MRIQKFTKKVNYTHRFIQRRNKLRPLPEIRQQINEFVLRRMIVRDLLRDLDADRAEDMDIDVVRSFNGKKSQDELCGGFER